MEITLKKNYKSPISDEDCRIIVDHLLTQKHREFLMVDLANFHKSPMDPNSVVPWYEDNGEWVAGHFQFRVKMVKSSVNRPNVHVEKTWMEGKYHKPNKGYH